jgi:short-subunit dehydrogenase
MRFSMTMTPTSVVAFVTGASRGIGFQIAQHVAPLCSDLVIASRTQASISVAAEQLLKKHECKVHALWGDLSGGRVVADAMSSKLEGVISRLDLLVLNAGYFVEGSFASIADDDFAQNFQVNALSSHYLVTSLLPLLRKSSRARIVIIGSTAAYEPYPLVPTYGFAKWALRGYAINLRRELMAENIGVSFIAPGGTLTDMWKGEDLPEGRLLDPADIAKLVTAMLSLSPQAVVEELIVRPMLGDIHE